MASFSGTVEGTAWGIADWSGGPGASVGIDEVGGRGDVLGLRRRISERGGGSTPTDGRGHHSHPPAGVPGGASDVRQGEGWNRIVERLGILAAGNADCPGIFREPATGRAV